MNTEAKQPTRLPNIIYALEYPWGEWWEKLDSAKHKSATSCCGAAIATYYKKSEYEKVTAERDALLEALKGMMDAYKVARDIVQTDAAIKAHEVIASVEGAK